MAESTEEVRLIFSGVRVNYSSERPINRLNVFLAPPQVFFGVKGFNKWFILKNVIYYEVGLFLNMMYNSDPEAFKIMLMEVDSMDPLFEKFYKKENVLKSTQFKNSLLKFEINDSVSVGSNANQYNVVQYEIHEMVEFIHAYQVFTGENKPKLISSVEKGIYSKSDMRKEIKKLKNIISKIDTEPLTQEFFNESLFEIRKINYVNWLRN